MSFATIPVRANGQKFFHDWFNSLRAAGVDIETFLGTGFLPEESFTLANNQVGAANITSLLFDPAETKAVHIYVEVRRTTSINELISTGRICLFYRALTTTWEIIDELSGDEDGVVFTITAGGQVQYTSSSLAGTGYVGTMKFKAITFAI